MNGYLNFLKALEELSNIYTLSAPLIVIFVEVMVLRLRENKIINGIKERIDYTAQIIKISQLADDTTLFVSSKTDIALAMNEVEIVGSF